MAFCPNGQKALIAHIMDFCGPYDKQVANTYRVTQITPLWGGWEFRQKPALSTGTAGWLALAKTYDWELSAPVRRDLISGEWAIVITDTSQIIRYVNNQFERMTGYKNHEAMDRRPDFLQGVKTDPASRQRIRKAIDQQKIVDERILNYRKDQTAYWCHIIIRPIVNRQKQVVNFVAFEQEIQSDDRYIHQ
jgi:PAS domain S-box-containing protein